jgi:hypothetical protein
MDIFRRKTMILIVLWRFLGKICNEWNREHRILRLRSRRATNNEVKNGEIINQSEILNIKYPTSNEIDHPHPFGMRLPPLRGEKNAKQRQC